MDSRDCLVGSSQDNPVRRFPMSPECNPSAEHWRQGMFLSAAQLAAVVEILSLRCVQGVGGTETRSSLRLNHW